MIPRYSFLLLLLLFVGRNAFSQKNSCELFVQAFNSSGEGFPSWRGNVAPSSLGIYDLPDDLFTVYSDLGLGSGMILCSKNLPSQYVSGKYFTHWTLCVYSKMLYPGDGISWDAAQEKYEAYYNMQCQQIHDACTPQLKLSPMLYSDRDDGREKFVRYLYHPAYTWPDSMTAGEAAEALREVAHIRITFAEKIFPKGRYEITYEISGVQYEP